jgi:pSer/pThr/pTyr-binding forkhead associated (FHA) protein
MPGRDVAEWEATYKYSCRKCHIRVRCILLSHAAPAIKDAMRNAFANRTDTQRMWGILQENCLLIKEEEEEAQKVHKESLLSQRLRKARIAREQVGVQEPAPPPETIPSKILRPTALTPPLVAPAEVPPTLPIEAATRHYLIVQPSERRIALPNDGELVLGRFDPNIGLSADVDLHRDDKGRLTVSRRHAKILASHGMHTIEDLGSTNGTKLNDHLLKLGEVAPLKPGDKIMLGHCQLSYEPIPTWLAELPADAACRYFLLVTATGHRFDLPTGKREIVIGRVDPLIGANPDIDLRGEGEISTRVSRRHARLTWEKEGHFLEDLGSALGTRVNGAVVWLGDRALLRPGDHIWLGGCVVAYDLELEQLELR